MKERLEKLLEENEAVTVDSHQGKPLPTLPQEERVILRLKKEVKDLKQDVEDLLEERDLLALKYEQRLAQSERQQVHVNVENEYLKDEVHSLRTQLKAFERAGSQYALIRTLSCELEDSKLHLEETRRQLREMSPSLSLDSSYSVSGTSSSERKKQMLERDAPAPIKRDGVPMLSQLDVNLALAVQECQEIAQTLMACTRSA
jgi:seryl-tRNA synthetase